MAVKTTINGPLSGSSNPTLQQDLFKHLPLDYSKASMCLLLRISDELSREGVLQCFIMHTMIHQKPYNCLTYM